jgi:hypothetical protein
MTVGQTSFNALTRTLTCVPSRRDVLGSLAGTGVGLGAILSAAFGALDADAKKKRDKKKK